MAEYADNFEYGSYAGSGSAPFNQQGNTTTVEGGGSQFVVEYKYGAEGDAALGGTHVDVQGGNSEFVIHVDGSSGNSTVDIDGGNNKFVVAFDNATGGNNVVHVNGGNNQFVVVFDYAGGSSEGNAVQVEGSNNQYIVSEDLTAIGGQASVSGDSGGSPVSYTSGQGSTGDHSGYNFDFASFGGQAGGTGGQASGNPFAAGFGGGAGGAESGAAAGANPFAGGQPGGAAAGFGGAQGSGFAGGDQSGDTGSQMGGGASGGGDLGSLLAQSPFGRLADVPGALDAFGEAIAQRSAADEAAGVGNPFGNAAPGTNPFESLGQGGGFGGQSGAGASNPFAGGQAGGQQQQSADASGGSEGGQDAGASNPFAGGESAAGFGGDAGGQAGVEAAGFGGAGGGDASNPFANFAPNPDYSYDYSSFNQGEAGEDSLTSMLRESPFAPLVDLGLSAEEIFGPTGDSGNNPFAAAGGFGGQSEVSPIA